MIDFSPSPVFVECPEIEAPPTGEHFWGRLKHRHDVDGKSILEHNGFKLLNPGEDDGKPVGIPSVIRAYVGADFTEFVCRWQRFSFSLIKMWAHERKPEWQQLQLESECKKIFAALYRSDAFQSNKNGSDIKRDCINDNNTNKEWIKLFPVFTGGNVVRIVGDAKNVYGTLCYPVRCFDGLHFPPNPNNVNWKTSPHLIQWATIETRILKGDNDREIRPFEYRELAGMPFFVLARGQTWAWIDAERVVRITGEQAFNNNPYA